MLKKTLKYTAYRIAPKISYYIDRFLLERRRLSSSFNVTGVDARNGHDAEALIAEAKRVRQSLESARSIEEIVDLLNQCSLIRSNQRRTEIIGFARLIEQLKPTTICEIGAAGGGTLALFAAIASPTADFYSIDLAYTSAQRQAFPLLISPTQKLTMLAGDSHAPGTFQALKQWLGNRRLDLLFIDGDHSYEGVAQDYEMYAPLVGTGGIVGFHDIIDDYKTRYGLPTTSDVGGVPAFWRELKARIAHSSEFVEHPWQDGLGIGVVRC